MDVKEMQRKYIAHFINRQDTLAEEDARTYLAYLIENLDAAFRERRITQLERHLRNLEQAKESAKASEEEWMAKAREICAIKERWEALGATFEEKHDCGVGLTTWKYRDVTIMRRLTGTALDEELTLVREGDVIMSELLEQEEESQ